MDPRLDPLRPAAPGTLTVWLHYVSQVSFDYLPPTTKPNIFKYEYSAVPHGQRRNLISVANIDTFCPVPREFTLPSGLGLPFPMTLIMTSEDTNEQLKDWVFQTKSNSSIPEQQSTLSKGFPGCHPLHLRQSLNFTPLWSPLHDVLRKQPHYRLRLK